MQQMKTFLQVKELCEELLNNGKPLVRLQIDSLARRLQNTKITQGEMTALDRLIYRKRELSASQAKNRLNLRASSRTVQKYLQIRMETNLYTIFSIRKQ